MLKGQEPAVNFAAHQVHGQFSDAERRHIFDAEDAARQAVSALKCAF
jgi:hypothetical protein